MKRVGAIGLLVGLVGCGGSSTENGRYEEARALLLRSDRTVEQRLTGAREFATADGAIRRQGTGTSVRLPQRGNGALELATGEQGERRLAMTLRGATASEAAIGARRVAYAGALRDTDLVVEAGERWLETFYLLGSVDAPHQFEWDVAATGLVAHTTNDGVEWWADGQPLFRVREGVAVDADNHRYRVRAELDGSTLRFTLEGTPRAYPVLVDPVVETLYWTWSTMRAPSMFGHKAVYDTTHSQSYVIGSAGGSTLETWQMSPTSWDRVGDATAPPARYGFALAYDAARDEIVLFGGDASRSSNTSLFNETWTYKNGAWTKKSPATAPSGRRDMSMVYDSGRQKIVLYGGDAGALTASSQTWEWNGTTWTQLTPATSPGSKQDYAMAYDANHAVTVLFGGSTDGLAHTNNTYTWNGTNWTLQAPATKPSARGGSGMSYMVNGATKQIVLFGGRDLSNAVLAETWVWDGSNWSKPTPATSPPARYGGEMWQRTSSNSACVFGGATVSNRVFCWDGTNWSEISFGLVARSGAALAYDSVRKKVVIFGGVHDQTTTDELQECDPTGSCLLRNITRPGARRDAAMVFDSTRNEMVLFGGRLSATTYNETWTFNGTTWTLKSPVNKPTPRTHHRMAFDSVRGRVVLFGGQDSGSANLQDTWEWTGTDWVVANPATKPPARYEHAMAYDVGRQRTVLYGGQTSTISILGDTWEWNGTTWTSFTPVHKPSGDGRTAATLTYDPDRATTILFGGRSTSGIFTLSRDALEWDGTDWTYLGAPTQPFLLPIFYHHTIWDPVRQSLLMYFGATDNPLPEEVWYRSDVRELAFEPPPPTFVMPHTGMNYWNGTMISGTAPAQSGLVVTVRQSGAPVCTANVNAATGAWSCTPSPPLAQGYVTLWAGLTKAGLWSSADTPYLPFTYDTIAPAAPSITSPANGGATNATMPVFNLSAETKTRVTVYEGAAEVCSIDVPTGTTASCTANSTMSLGAHTVFAKTVDYAGNPSAASANVTFTIDTTPPGAPTLTTPADGGSTNDSTPLFSGTKEAGSGIDVKEGASVLCTVPIDSSTSWSCSPSVALSEASHFAFASAFDLAGNSAIASGNSFVVDLTPPAVPVIATPLANARLNDSTPDFTGTKDSDTSLVVKEGAATLCTVAGGSATSWSCTSTVTLTNGSHTVIATATDVAGNPRDSLSRTLVIDTIAPAVPTITSPTAGQLTNNPTPTITGTKEANTAVDVKEGATILCSVALDASTSWSCAPSSPLATAKHTIFAVSTDGATNSSTSSTVQFVVDTVAPAVPVLTAPTDGQIINTTTPLFTGTREANTAIAVKEGATTLCTVASGSATSWSCTSSALAVHPHTVVAVSTDAATNSTSSAAISFGIDITAPATPTITSPSAGQAVNSAAPTFSGGKEANTSIVVKEGATTLCSVALDASTSWSCQSGSALGNGAHSVIATATDIATNPTPSAARSFTIDTVAPTAPSITAPASGAATNDTTPTFTGSKEANTSIDVKSGAVVVCTVALDASTSWTCTPGSPITPGTYAFVAVSTDAATNATASAPATTLTIDTTPPTSPTFSSPTPGQITSNLRPTFSGTREANTSVDVKEGATVLCSAPSAFATIWSCTPGSDLGETSHNVVAVATDAATNTASSGALSFTIDTSAPIAPTFTAPTAGQVVNATQPAFVGTKEANSSVVVKEGATTLCSVAASPSTSWTCMPSSPLASGAHSVVATSTNQANNSSSSPALAFSIDVTAPAAPVISAPTAGQALNTTSPTFTGTKEADTSLQIKEGVVVVCSVPIDASTSWTCSPSSALAAGAHTVTAVATDAATNATSTAPLTFTVDVTPPSAPVISAPTASQVVGNTKPTFTGTKEANTRIEVKEDLAVLCSVPIDASTSWSCSPSSGLAESSHTIVAVATDGATNATTSAPVTFSIDITPPGAPAITFPAAGAALNLATPTLTGTKDANTKITIKEGTTTLCAVALDGSTSWTCALVAALGNGTHTLVAIAEDVAGNSATSTPVTFMIDLTAPAAPVITAPTPGQATSDVHFLFVGTKEANTSIELKEGALTLCTVSLDATTTWSCSVAGSLSEGIHTVTAVATDAATNATAGSDVTFTVDTIAPAAPTFVAPVAGAALATTMPTFSGTKDAGADVTIKESASVVCAVARDGLTTWSCSATSDLAQGAHSLTATSRDAAQNPSLPSVALAFTVDTVAPGTPVLTAPTPGQATNDTTPTFAGTKEAGARVEVREGGSVLCTVASDSATVWACAPGAALSVDAHTVFALIVDAAGNSSSSASVGFVIDTTPPSTPTVSSPAAGQFVADATPTFTGGKEAGTSIVVKEGATTLCSAPLDGSTSWACTPGLALGNGAHTVVATAGDAAGNTTSGSGVAFSIDTIAPSAPVFTAPLTGQALPTTTPTFTGTKEADTGVEVRLGASTLCSVARNASTSWSCVSSVLSQGNQSVVAVAIDAAGNTGTSMLLTFSVDTLAPLIPQILSPSPGAVLAATAPAFAGTKEPDTGIVVREGVSTLCTVAADVSSTWTCTPSSALAQGAHNIVATSTDAAGNGTDSAAVGFTVDSVAPAAPSITAPTDAQVIATTTPTIIGSKEANTGIVVKKGALTLCTAQLDSSTSWACTSSALNQGQHTITAVATDEAGNPSASTTRTFEVDTGVPTAPTFATPAEGAAVASTTPTLSGNKDGATSIVVKEGATTICTVALDAQTTWTCTSVTLGQGAHTIIARSADSGGNAIDSAPLHFTIDTVAPSTPIIDVPAAAGLVADDTPTISGQKEADTSIVVKEGPQTLCTIAADSTTAWSCTSATLAQGSHTVTATATDSAGNTASSSTRTFSIDSDAPDAPVFSAPFADATLAAAQVVFAGTKVAGTAIEVREGPTLLCAVALDAATDWTCSSTLGNGPHDVTAVAIDLASNPSLPTLLHFNVDTVVPEAPTITAPAAGAFIASTTVVLSGEKPSDTAIAITEGATEVCVVPRDAATVWTCTLNGVGQGAHTYSARAVDEASNASGSVTRQITVDTIAPTQPTIASPAVSDVMLNPVVVSGSAETGATVSVYIDGASGASCTTTAAAGAYSCSLPALTVGSHSVTVVAKDAAGNSSVESSSNGFSVSTPLVDLGSDDGGGDLATLDLSDVAPDLGASDDAAPAADDLSSSTTDLASADLSTTPDLANPTTVDMAELPDALGPDADLAISDAGRGAGKKGGCSTVPEGSTSIAGLLGLAALLGGLRRRRWRV